MDLIFLSIISMLKCVEWTTYNFLSVNDQWIFLLGFKYLVIAVLLSHIASIQNKSIIVKSILVLFCIDAWADLLSYVFYQINGIEPDFSKVLFLLFSLWSIWILNRKYEISSDEINNEDVFILVLKPKKFFDIAKGLLGLPYSSICILLNNGIYSFSKKSNKYIKRKLSEKWVNTHLVINTKVKINKEITEELNRIIGSDRGIGVKCVYQIRNVLKLLGEEWKPKTIFHYIPGVYLIQILRAISGKKL